MVMLQHTRSSPYLVQFFKQPLQAPCACVICRDGLWSPFKLTAELAADLPHSWQVPLPIPIPVEAGQPMHYMPLHEAMQHTFTEEHQPSLIDRNESRTKRRARPSQTACQPHPRAQNICGQDSTNKIISRPLARGVVSCKDCMKPRLIYSTTSPSRMVPPVVDGVVPTPQQVADCQRMAKDVLQDAMQSTSYVCGAPVLDPDHPFHSVFQAQSTLTCSDPVEPFFYSCHPGGRSGLSALLCCFCALGDGLVDDELKSQFKTVLPVCGACIVEGALIPGRQRTNNSAARAARAAKGRYHPNFGTITINDSLKAHHHHQ